MTFKLVTLGPATAACVVLDRVLAWLRWQPRRSRTWDADERDLGIATAKVAASAKFCITPLPSGATTTSAELLPVIHLWQACRGRGRVLLNHLGARTPKDLGGKVSQVLNSSSSSGERTNVKALCCQAMLEPDPFVCTTLALWVLTSSLLPIPGKQEEVSAPNPVGARATNGLGGPSAVSADLVGNMSSCVIFGQAP
eukprot:CAMPEP_0115184600 /NCGR_PEP_ID=MMETSP0270-20121206/9045_1 /TAXON_ID=71861 /ORGANISM="Scrippsiella trochoidea, Strain CCMP3099" /LENGTH=196 /DNA_ID=CAMNT_0002597689 /DNA_START=217 /DNA_END=808 /DNA_ORIENTATION=-